MVNLLIDDVETGADPEAITAALSCVSRYANEHFMVEERLLRDRSYPNYEAHVSSHRAFRRQIIKFHHDTWWVNPEAPAALARFLKDWWWEHILEEDMEYREFLIRI